MTDITITQGLNIPIEGEAVGAVEKRRLPLQVGWNFDAFEDTKFRLLVKPNDEVSIGTPLVEDKEFPGRYFVSYFAGKVVDIRRGEKRRLRAIALERKESDQKAVFSPQKLSSYTREDIIKILLEKGIFAFIRSRPFNQLANPYHLPRAIFIKAIETAPFIPSAEMQVSGYEEEFSLGLSLLQKLTEGKVHLVYAKETTCTAFSHAEGVEKHTITGPHPAGNSSVHIHHIAPIRSVEDRVWTVNVLEVIAIGMLFSKGTLFSERVISVAGSGVFPQKRGYVRGCFGHSIKDLINGKEQPGAQRIISGDPLTGEEVAPDDFLGAFHTAVAIIPDVCDREFLHFFRLGSEKYTASRAYLSGHVNNSSKRYFFTTSQHGEERAFIDSSIYQKVMPIKILPMQLVKAVLAEDFELAEQFGLLEIDSEDFALLEFICPSKIKMMDIVKEGLKAFSEEHLGK